MIIIITIIIIIIIIIVYFSSFSAWDYLPNNIFNHLHIYFVFTHIPCILILSKFFNSPTDAQLNCLKNN